MLFATDEEIFNRTSTYLNKKLFVQEFAWIKININILCYIILYILL